MMTREETYSRIDAIIAKYEIDDEYVTITNSMDYDALRMARELLEQESVLDKIKEEIKDNTYFINETTEKEGIDLETVEKIIDKYKAEGKETDDYYRGAQEEY